MYTVSVLLLIEDSHSTMINFTRKQCPLWVERLTSCTYSLSWCSTDSSPSEQISTLCIHSHLWVHSLRQNLVIPQPCLTDLQVETYSSFLETLVTLDQRLGRDKDDERMEIVYCKLLPPEGGNGLQMVAREQGTRLVTSAKVQDGNGMQSPACGCGEGMVGDEAERKWDLPIHILASQDLFSHLVSFLFLSLLHLPLLFEAQDHILLYYRTILLSAMMYHRQYVHTNALTTTTDTVLGFIFN